MKKVMSILSLLVSMIIASNPVYSSVEDFELTVKWMNGTRVPVMINESDTVGEIKNKFLKIYNARFDDFPEMPAHIDLRATIAQVRFIWPKLDAENQEKASNNDTVYSDLVTSDGSVIKQVWVEMRMR